MIRVTNLAMTRCNAIIIVIIKFTKVTIFTFFLGHRHHHHDPIISCDACQKLVTGCREVGVDFGQCSSTVSTVFGKMFHHCQQYLEKYQHYQSVPSLSLGVYHEIAKNQCIPGNHERMLVKGSSMILFLFLEMKASS